MQTTGTVLLNARGCNINGYDCFVNLSKDMKKYSTTCWFNQLDGVTPLSGYQIWNGVTNSSTKFSPVSFSFSNYSDAYIVFTINASIPTTFTVSTWQKGVVLNESQAQNNDIRKAHYRTKEFSAFAYLYARYNNITKSVQVRRSSGWVEQAHSVNFANDNWHHYALTRSGNRIMVFIDGIMVFDKSYSDWYSQGYFLRLRGICQTMYADDLVVIAGQALWTSNFTPPSTYLLDSEYAMDLSDVKRRNIILSNVDKKLIIPDEETLKQY